jgi:RHS repeat-associated protein
MFPVSGLRLAVFALFLFPLRASLAQENPRPPVPECAHIASLAQRAECERTSLNQVRVYEDYDKRLRDNEQVTPLTSSVFGEEVSLSNGATSFSVVDIALSGNSAIPVELRRTFTVESKRGPTPLGGFGSWDLDVPHLVGVFDSAYLWNLGGNGEPDRCSDLWYPKVTPGLNLNDVWSGTQFHLPGKGDQELLFADTGAKGPATPMPSAGGPFPWTARGDIRFSCTSMLQGYPGQGFVAHLPDGTKYFLNVAVNRAHGSLKKDGATIGRTRIYLMASRVEDRFGQGVNYQWVDGRLELIQADDGRAIDLEWTGAKITSVTAHGRQWSYVYGGTLGDPPVEWLSEVRLTDSTYSPAVVSKWTYTRTSGTLVPYYPTPDIPNDANCIELPPPADNFVFTATHPAGVKGIFYFGYRRHYRSGVPQTACTADGNGYYSMAIPHFSDIYSLTEKRLVGVQGEVPGPLVTPTLVWGYHYDTTIFPRSTYSPCDPSICAESKLNAVEQPDGSLIEYEFGALHEVNDGRLLKTRTNAPSSGGGYLVLREEQNVYYTDAEYAAANPKPFPPRYGINSGGTDDSTRRIRPIKQTVITENGATFSQQTTAFDVFARPTTIVRSSSGLMSAAGLTGYSRTETRGYHDNFTRWIVGQTKYVATGTAPTLCTSQAATTPECTKYDDAQFALPTERYAFGRLTQRTSYHVTGTQSGLPHFIYDADNVKKTTLTNYHRGIPRDVEFEDGYHQSAVVNDHGEITRLTNELGDHTDYARDGMGRLKSITYPTGDTTNWTVKSFETRPLAASETGLGIGLGHWLHRTLHGNYRKDVYLDALWRPVLTHEYDSTSPSTTSRYVRREFDHANRDIFTSYPVSSVSSWNSPANGISHQFDALGRPKLTTQYSVPTNLTTKTFYEPNFVKRVENPRQLSTSYHFKAFDQPDAAWPMRILQPEGITTVIQRDAFGNPETLTRSGPDTLGGTISHTRTYSYNAHKQLCKRLDPETDATHFGYDPSGNLWWTLTGSTASGWCDVANPPPPVGSTERTYDDRNRLIEVDYPDPTVDLFYQYYADGALHKAWTGLWNLPDPNSKSTWTYEYNKRRLLTGEHSQLGAGKGKQYSYIYNALGHVSTMHYPSGAGVYLDYVPNVYGQPTRVGTYATGIKYHPNGMVDEFVFGNGITRENDLHPRNLIERVRDRYLPTGAVFHDFQYAYDPNGNVTTITDHGGAGYQSRSMGYDDVDRLETATALQMWGNGSFTYDAVDNLRQYNVGAAQYRYFYNSKNQLQNLKTPANATIFNYGHDARGNVVSKQGSTTSVFYSFDEANRLTDVPGSIVKYSYDAHGRRVGELRQVGPSIVGKYAMYTQDGLMRGEFNASSVHTSHIYLGKQLIATQLSSGTWPNGATYHHTDALGSPVKETGPTRGLVSTKEYRPYGDSPSFQTIDGPGYTGHIEDGATGLVYMQQRYYDPQIGRFLSIDSVGVDTTLGTNFSRYAYAGNNPYAFTDPDGRIPRSIVEAWSWLNGSLQEDEFNACFPHGCSAQQAASLRRSDQLRQDVNAALAVAGGMPAAGLRPAALRFGSVSVGPMARTAADAGSDFFAGTKYTDKVIGQMKAGDNHAFPESVKAFQDDGVISKITGGDGIEREMLKIRGEYNGKKGYFEFIKEPNGDINHRLFRPDGK